MLLMLQSITLYMAESLGFSPCQSCDILRHFFRQDNFLTVFSGLKNKQTKKKIPVGDCVMTASHQNRCVENNTVSEAVPELRL